ncbi:protein SCO1/2 [Mangrovibacterium marinum]|uniref:Protein SCO1/2 n=1 Tax=Mangrovibacterium marinum TaxID=1639118 RepID=A0A2T5C2G9_9BACT|nr:SCO family protein [Mangrovibacterium marinum]PTN08857.1 protein SCO1/2 [Mangrovibacterium marinum]
MINIKHPKPTLLIAFALLLFTKVTLAQNISFEGTNSDPEIGVIEHLDEYLPKDIYLLNEDSQRVVLTDLIDKPTVLNFVYYRCPGICSPLMEGLAEVMDKSDLTAGKDYQVLTISFDPSETLELAKRKKTNYLNLVNKKEEIAKGWQFFLSDSASIAKATNAVGFKYKRQGNDFLHAASVMVISPDGKITRYLNGLYFLPFEFKMAIIEANKGQSGPTINKVLQFCYSFDPVGQTYVLNVTKITGTLILFIALILFLYLIFKPKKKK